MELNKPQSEVILNKSRYKVLNWGRRSGKTTLFAYEALGTALTIPNAKITYYAQTFGDARDIAWDIFLEVFGDAVLKKNETLLEIVVANLSGGTSKISLKGWESVVTSQKGRGTENDLLLVDEVAFCRGFNEYWETVLEPTLLTTNGRAVFGSTPNGFNDFYYLADKAQKQDGWFYSHATSYDNEANNKKWLDDKRATMPEDRFSQEYLADFRKTEGLVYKEFTRGVHIYDDMEIDEVVDMAGVDFGFTNPTAVIRVAKDKRGCYWVKSEWYERGKTDAQSAEVISAMNITKVYPDPENPGAIKELRDRQVNVMEVLKGNDSIKSGINKIRELLKQRRLKVHRSCVNLIWEFETYHYPKTVDGKNDAEVPVKENDHALDALRYVILMDAESVEIKQYDAYINHFRDSKKRINPAR